MRFAGLDAYTAAGGGIRRDLFAEGDAGTYLTDATLLETLVRGKLDALAGDVRAEGWAWVEAVPHMSYAERQAFQNAPRQRREPSAREARRIASLQTRLDKIDTELEEAYDAEDEDKTEALEPRREQVAGELQAVEEALQGYAPDVRAVAGAIVTLDRSGEAVIHRGLLREAEAGRCARWNACGRVSAARKARPGTTTKARTPSSPRPRACPTGWRSG